MHVLLTTQARGIEGLEHIAALIHGRPEFFDRDCH
jgi:hypothetical protein